MTEPHLPALDPHQAFCENESVEEQKHKKPSSPKLSVKEVDDLRLRIGSGEESVAAAARRLGRSETSVRRAVRGPWLPYLGYNYAASDAPLVPPRATPGRPPTVSEEAVRAVRGAKGTEKAGALAARLGISRRHVYRIWAGEAREGVPSSIEEGRIAP